MVEFFCAGAGGPESTMPLAALDSNGIDPGTRGEVLAILWSLKGDVIRV